MMEHDPRFLIGGVPRENGLSRISTKREAVFASEKAAQADFPSSVEEGRINAKSPLRRRSALRFEESPPFSGSTWLLSFTDVMGLLLTFFVMLYAISTPKKDVWEGLTQTFQENLSLSGEESAPLGRGEEESAGVQRTRFVGGLNLGYLKSILAELLSKEASLKDVRLIDGPHGLILSLPSDLLFDEGKADVKETGLRALYTLSSSLQRIKNRLEVVGHADPRSPSGGRYANNWELSFDRAAKVSAVLVRNGYDRSIFIRGMAAARYQDLPSAWPEEKKRSLSRRVDIMIMEDTGKKMKHTE